MNMVMDMYDCAVIYRLTFAKLPLISPQAHDYKNNLRCENYARGTFRFKLY